MKAGRGGAGATHHSHQVREGAGCVKTQKEHEEGTFKIKQEVQKHDQLQRVMYNTTSI